MSQKVHKKKIKELIHNLALKYNLSDDIAEKLVNSPYEFSFEIMQSLNLDDVDSKEELEELGTNFYYKCFGKLFIPYSRLYRRNEQKKSMKNLNKEKWNKK